MDKTPAVSVVMAAYNRSNLLRYSIGSLRRGHWQDWELIVVGDACTDDTAAVVAGFGDPRIRFVNLPQNFGEQSGPNNHGVGLARGRYLAFLNQDDLWLADHLQRSVMALERGGADLVFGMGLQVRPTPPHVLLGALCGERQRYEPWMRVPASLWVMCRELAARIGPWKPAWELRVVPSQDWLYRAHRAGARLVADPVLCAVIINSGSRANSYRDRTEHEHALWYARLEDGVALHAALTATIGAYLKDRMISVSGNAYGLVGSIVRRLMLVLRLWPTNPFFWIKYWRKGSFLRDLRRVRGLEDRGGRG